MANDKDFILKNAIEVGGSTKVTIGDAPASGSVTVGYDLSVAAYANKFLSVGSEETNPQSITISNDGTKVYAVGSTNDRVYQYNLTTAWDLSSGSYSNLSFSVSAQDSNPQGIFFKSDGTKMYISGASHVLQYSLSTAWNISTADASTVVTLDVSTYTNSTGSWFKPDGTKLYVFGSLYKEIFQYTMSTAWDLNTATYDSVSYAIPSSPVSAPARINIKPDGTKLYVTDSTLDGVYQFSIATPWDISTASYDSISFSAQSEDTNIKDIRFSSDGAIMYLSGSTNDKLYQYSTGSTVATATFDTSTGNYFTHTPSADSEYGFSNAGDVQTFQLEVTGAQSIVPYDLTNGTYDGVFFSVTGQRGLTFKPDGTKMYTTSSTILREFDLSTAWDLTTASLNQTATVAGNSNGIFFKPDGTVFFVAGDDGNRIYEYTLSTAWDISTASSGTDFSVTSQETNPTGVFFRADGLKMYITGTLNDDVFEYTLSTAWDIDTASYTQNVAVLNESTPNDVFFKPDGTVMYVTGAGDDDVDEYTLTTAWDVTTASYSGNRLNLSGLTSPAISSAHGTYIKPDGTKLYVACPSTNKIYEFNIASSTPITITWDADIEWGGGTAPDSPASGQKDLYTITTDDGGTTYFGVPSGVAFS